VNKVVCKLLADELLLYMKEWDTTYIFWVRLNNDCIMFWL